MTPEQTTQFNEMYQWFKDMQFSSSIPLATDQAFRARFSNLGSLLTTSTTTAASKTQAVNEAGVAAYSVSKAPDAILQVNLNGSVYYVGVFI